MHCNSDRLRAYGFVRIRTILLFYLFLPFAGRTQDTTLLQNVDVIGSKRELSELGKKVERIDSTVKEQFRFASVGDVLSYNSPIYIKSYGPGALSTTAFRGGNAEQTAVMWNGFNLQNAMLGQADLSLLPSILFDQVSVEYGGSSAVWGSGAVGGSIHLDAKLPFNRGLQTTLNAGGGSFGTINTSARVLYSRQRFVSSTKLYMNNSENNFRYKDSLEGSSVIRRQKHARYEFRGLMQEMKFIFNKYQMVSVNLWASDNQRQIPAYDPTATSKADQRDQAFRSSLSWSYVRQRYKSVLKGAVFAERIRYNDSLATIYSDGKVQTVMLDNENYFHWGSKNVLNIGASALSSNGVSDGYSSHKNISKVSVLAGNKFSFLNERIKTYTSVRAEYYSIGTLPITGNVALDYQVLKSVLVSLNAAKIYRQPTLNELFWTPGGSPDLKPEEGYSAEGNVAFRKKFRAIVVVISASAFTRRIDNWILWVPGTAGNPSAKNIQQVWSRGTETNSRIDFRKQKFRVSLQVGSGYVLSTTEATSLENADNIGKQLIYTPPYNLNGHVSVGYDQLECLFFHQYVGYRFTAGDNSKWLNPYQTSSLKLNYKIVLQKLNLALFGACNNLFNSSYHIVAGRPMPLRAYEFGITVQTK